MLELPSSRTIQNQIKANAIEAKLLRQQYRAALQLEQVRGDGEDLVGGRIALPVGATSAGHVILALVPPTTTPYDRERVADARDAGDWQRLVDVLAEVDGILATAERRPGQ